jgi:hypothetical protein
MRKSRLLIAALFMMCFQLVKASPIDPSTSEKMRMQIAKMISSATWEESKKFNITFIVTRNNEIIVTKTNDESIDEEVKALLNYKKIDVEGLTPYEVYILPVVIQK